MGRAPVLVYRGAGHVALHVVRGGAAAGWGIVHAGEPVTIIPGVVAEE
ncbi:Uncharacterized protein MK0311 [Methanopyrus kandleri AV19]|uniref:Uncharacterized protein n=1 Tax=Methanopyrus kandleri (strain AV19 / DSM 6324 / JCM 9639 / NBRC 100938) TaxID=190192 RepID=Q8TYI6_METKA|nr:Uncharacterized protein MK0311 [Methanopyrus kandleri AV19]